MKMFRPVAWLALCGLLAGCSSHPPKGLEAPEPSGPTAAEVRAEPARHVGATVRWGGEILSVRNGPRSTEVEVYQRPLFDDASPQPDGGDGVRFIARVERFLDPAEYQAGKRLTVRGRVAEPLVREVGEYPYRYPVVEVERFELWPVYQPPRDPYWYDPYYDPWGPWGPWGPWRYRPYW